MSESLNGLSAETFLRLYERLEQRVAELEAQMEMILSEPEEGEVEFYMDGTPVKT